MKTTPALRQRIGRASAGAAVITLLGVAAWYGYDTVISQPVKRVLFSGSTERIPVAALDALARDVQATPGGASLAAVRDAARRIAWVREAAVRRRFPDTVEIQLETHTPLARWNEAALVSRRGEVFVADYDAALPRFRGADSAAALMAHQYPAMVAALGPLGSAIAEVRLSARGAWQVTLDSGLELDLGRGGVEARLARFVSAWPQLTARGIAPAHADLRYPNGFALRKKTLSPALSQGRG